MKLPSWGLPLSTRLSENLQLTLRRGVVGFGGRATPSAVRRHVSTCEFSGPLLTWKFWTGAKSAGEMIETGESSWTLRGCRVRCVWQ